MSLDLSDESDFITKAMALIRANFNIEPRNLSDEEFASLFCQAIWLETWRLRNLAQLLSKIFS